VGFGAAEYMVSILATPAVITAPSPEDVIFVGAASTTWTMPCHSKPGLSLPGISGIFLDEYNSSNNINSTYYSDLYSYITTNQAPTPCILALAYQEVRLLVHIRRI
jgi:hypothetical protein